MYVVIDKEFIKNFLGEYLLDSSDSDSFNHLLPETDPELGREDEIDVFASNRSSGGLLRSSISGQIIKGSIPITLSAPKSNADNPSPN